MTCVSVDATYQTNLHKKAKEESVMSPTSPVGTEQDMGQSILVQTDMPQSTPVGTGQDVPQSTLADTPRTVMHCPMTSSATDQTAEVDMDNAAKEKPADVPLQDNTYTTSSS